MPKPLGPPRTHPDTVIKIRELRGGFTAQVVGEMFDLNAETVRRIWRGESHRKVGMAVPGATGEGRGVDVEESLARLKRITEQIVVVEPIALPPRLNKFDALMEVKREEEEARRGIEAPLEALGVCDFPNCECEGNFCLGTGFDLE